jgi:L-serine/L-threonine ammonia-lyase
MKADLYVKTPLWHSAPMSAALGRPAYLKMEAFQPAASFKSRGMGVRVKAAQDAGANQVVCASGGNAGLAVAYAGKVLGMRVSIVVPESTGQRARELILAQDAHLEVIGESWAESYEYALSLAEDGKSVQIHPFDDPLVWAGHASMAHEMAATGIRPGAVVVSVGGGGLIAGLLQGMHEVGWQDVPVIATETEGAASLAASMQAGQLVSLDAIRSVAVTLGAKQVCQEALDWTRRHEVRSYIMSDGEAVEACLRFADDHRVLVEPACGAALAAGYGQADVLAGLDPVLFIVCGGAAVTRNMLDGWAKDFKLS